MVWLTTGNIEELFNAAGFNFAVEAKTKDDKQMELDLRRTFFVGTNQQAQHHIETWRNAAKLEYYQQGNMSAGDLAVLFKVQKPFMDNEALEKLAVWQKPCHFAFIDDQGVLCGLIVFFRPNNPSKWLIGLVKNTHLAPKERTFTLLSNFDLMEFTPNGLLETREAVFDDFRKQISNSFVNELCDEVLNSVNNPNKFTVFRLLQLVRTLKPEVPTDVLADPVPFEKIVVKDFFAQNRALDLITEHGLTLTTELLLDCVHESNGLRKAIENATLTSDFKQNKVLLGLVVLFYEAKILDLCTEFFSDQSVLATLDKLMRDVTCSALIIEIIKAQYLFNFFKQIISNEAYYASISPLLAYLALPEKRHNLFKRGLEKQFNKKNKPEELIYIHSLKDDKLKTLCLYFWFKGDLTLEEYQSLVNTITKGPYLIEVLLALGKTKKYFITELKDIAFSPLKSQTEVILYQLADDFNNQQITINAAIKTILSLPQEQEPEKKLMELVNSYTVLNGLKFNKPKDYDELKQQTETIVYQFAENFRKQQIKIKEALQTILSIESKQEAAIKLIGLVNSYSVLKNLTLSKPNDYYLLVAQNNYKGKLLSLFLPTFAKYKVCDNDKDQGKKILTCQALVELLYVGVMDGAISQRNRIKELSDPELKIQAQELHECFLCAQQMESLGFDKSVLEFVIGNDSEAAKLRQIIFKVEDKGEKILERISASPDTDRSQKIALWNKALNTYKTALYRIAYDGLNRESRHYCEDVCAKISIEEAKILAVVDPDDKSWLEKALIVIANIVISTLTLGLANYIKEKKTQHYWFFTQSPSGEEIRALDKEIGGLIKR